MVDLLVYAFFAKTMAEIVLSIDRRGDSVLFALGTFGLSWLVRPLGAVVIGGYSDRAGRKAGLTLSATLMTIGVLLTAVLPTYAVIGAAAPALLMLARLIQGFSAGGEFGAANTFLTEQSPQHRGLLASMQFSATGISTLLAAGLCLPHLREPQPRASRELGMAGALCFRLADRAGRLLHAPPHGQFARILARRREQDPVSRNLDP